jgi:hypothetical protein
MQVAAIRNNRVHAITSFLHSIASGHEKKQRVKRFCRNTQNESQTAEKSEKTDKNTRR